MASASASLAIAKVEGDSLVAELANCDAVTKAEAEREAAKEAARLIEKETVVAREERVRLAQAPPPPPPPTNTLSTPPQPTLSSEYRVVVVSSE